VGVPISAPKPQDPCFGRLDQAAMMTWASRTTPIKAIFLQVLYHLQSKLAGGSEWMDSAEYIPKG
jgi:hypothetical protein